ncbi:MAG: MBL fold metallo-hydrolase [Candidatus Omnitrophica bacterium]|nr:MBL fold metallo-hydrolase [Candidatus Omnitrophota bacterium]MBU2044012.1 MBL fold metallo-hydrolase [Candidatus Omnitrophota bacterium]MBU2250642.1 MBL fold metallo-hydrolase [Candidatus Omnitrophota bacterium]MBU2473940.1 MBL fold metallo-hydrolase [Candidatus Omnitrophota bacterium]
MTVTIKFCGGARTVTGSMHLVSADHTSVLLDCGLFHGRRDEAFQVNSNFSFNPQSLKAAVVSHAHIDHCGNVPTLIKKGYRSHIFATPVTKKLLHYMLPDSGYVQEEDVKYVNKINKRRHLPSRQPLYTKQEAGKALKYIRSLEYHAKFAISREIDLTFYEAGHILGSGIPVLDIKTSYGPMRIAYAVDLGRYNMPLLKNPEVPKDVDYLIIESTYGGRRHDSIIDAEEELADAINRTVKRGGKIIIPSFALERTQLIVFFISELIKRNKIKKIPIYVDSPLAVNLTKVFRENWQYFDDITQQAFQREEDPLGYDNITYITQVNNSKRLNEKKNPMIIISASGMCENGRILHHLKNNIENPHNTIVIIGFMAKDTLGRRIVERNETVKIFGHPHRLNAEVVTLNAFSSHADQDGLVEYAKNCRGRLKQVFIVHGEEEQSEVLRTNLKKLNLKVSIPAKDETVFLSAR